MSIVSLISGIIESKSAIMAALESKGVTVLPTDKLDTVPTLINSIQQGGYAPPSD